MMKFLNSFAIKLLRVSYSRCMTWLNYQIYRDTSRGIKGENLFV